MFVIAAREEKILFSTQYHVKEIDLDSGVVKDLANHSSVVYSLAYDAKERYVYVPRYHEHVIERYAYYLLVFLKYLFIYAYYPDISFNKANT